MMAFRGNRYEPMGFRCFVPSDHVGWLSLDAVASSDCRKAFMEHFLEVFQWSIVGPVGPPGRSVPIDDVTEDIK